MPSRSTRYVVRARFVQGEQPVSDRGVELFEHDPGRTPTRLAEGRTGADGSVELSFTQGQAGGSNEGAPEVSIGLVGDEPPGRTAPREVHPDTPLDFGTIDLAAAGAPAGNAASLGTGEGEVAGSSGASGGRMPANRDPDGVPGSARPHGTTTREITAPQSLFTQGPFGRMFRKLQPWTPPGASEAEKDQKVRDIAATMFEAVGEGGNPTLDNPGIPSGYTYFGQFIDHDITFDPTSSLTKRNDPDRLLNFRTPRFDLDNLYGEGPDDEPFMYDKDRPGRFLIGPGPAPDEDDLPRNLQGTALIGDKRNDENIIVGQLQLAFLKLHNVVIDHVEQAENLRNREAFDRAQELVRWHYQYVVLTDFLPRLCGEDMLRDKLGFDVDQPDPDDIRLKFYKPRQQAYMPVEFSVAAYRLGHSMIRGRYDLNRHVPARPIFVGDPNAGPLDDLRGFRPLPLQWTLDWRRFLELGAGAGVQPSRRIDTRLAAALSAIHPGGASLAQLNLLRGFKMGLPSGQAVARAMRAERVLTNAEIGLATDLAGQEAPLWLYILKEAEMLGKQGARLGPVGGRIVAEVFLGLAKNDPNCFFNVDPGWSPAEAIAGRPLVQPRGRRLELGDLIRAAGVGNEPFPIEAPALGGWR
jgi:hypothetical protein